MTDRDTTYDAEQARSIAVAVNFSQQYPLSKYEMNAASLSSALSYSKKKIYLFSKEELDRLIQQAVAAGISSCQECCLMKRLEAPIK